MKRKIDLVDKEHESEDEGNESSSDESEDEEPRIKDVLSHLSQTKPRALNTLLDGLAELGIDKGLIRNKKLVFDLIEKEKDFRNSENTFENESNVESSSDREEDGEELASVNGSGDEDTQESDNDSENDSEETESSSPEPSTVIHSENLCEHCENSNVYGTLIMKCPKCFWHDYYKSSLICDHQIPEERNYIKEGFLRCHDCGAITHKNVKLWKPVFVPLLKRRTKKGINFHPFQIAVYLTRLVTGFQ